MIWPFRALLGPALWAIAFALIYGLHGAGCAWHWPARPGLGSDLQQTVLIGTWVVFLVATGGNALCGPCADDRAAQIVRAGGWIGFVAVALTLFPVLGLTTCG